MRLEIRPPRTRNYANRRLETLRFPSYGMWHLGEPYYLDVVFRGLMDPPRSATPLPAVSSDTYLAAMVGVPSIHLTVGLKLLLDAVQMILDSHYKKFSIREFYDHVGVLPKRSVLRPTPTGASPRCQTFPKSLPSTTRMPRILPQQCMLATS